MPARTRTLPTELLRLHPPGIRDQQRPVVRDELLLQLNRARRIVVLRVVRDDRLGDCLADGVHLRRVSSSLHPHTDVDGREGLFADDEDWLVDFVPEDLGLHEVDGRAVDLNQSTAFTGVCDRGGGLRKAVSLSEARNIQERLEHTFFLPNVWTAL